MPSKRRDRKRAAAANEPKAMDPEVFRRVLVLVAPMVPERVLLFMGITKATRAEFWAPPGVAMAIVVDRN
eukprot:3319333-Rhodomonas_salina.1